MTLPTLHLEGDLVSEFPCVSGEPHNSFRYRLTLDRRQHESPRSKAVQRCPNVEDGRVTGQEPIVKLIGLSNFQGLPYVRQLPFQAGRMGGDLTLKLMRQNL